MAMQQDALSSGTQPPEDERATLAALIENTSDFIGIASLDGTARFLNQAGRRLIGLAEGDPMPGDVAVYLAPPDRPRFVQEIAPRLATHGRWDGELCLMRVDDGAEIPVLAHTFHILDPVTRAPKAIATICRDIRERKLAERRLQTLQDELAHANRLQTIGELTASIAHEVNQPLAAIAADANACVRWLAHSPPDLAEARASAQRIARDAMRASVVIRRVRALAAHATAEPQQTDLDDAIREVLQILTGEIAVSRTSVHLSPSDVPAVVTFDRVQFQQVMLNLLLNALDAMRDVHERPRELTIRTTVTDERRVEVRVRDTGVGVSPEQATRMFEPFFTTKTKGVGLGLAICRRIVEAHDGRLWAHPNADHGTTFVISLPEARS